MEIQSGNGKSRKYSWLSAPSSFSAYKKSEASCLESCICQRKRGLIVCTCCQKSFVGRIGERCIAHPEVNYKTTHYICIWINAAIGFLYPQIAYLMDARNCAFCGAAAKDLRMATDQMWNKRDVRKLSLTTHNIKYKYQSICKQMNNEIQKYIDTIMYLNTHSVPWEQWLWLHIHTYMHSFKLICAYVCMYALLESASFCTYACMRENTKAIAHVFGAFYSTDEHRYLKHSRDSVASATAFQLAVALWFK